MFDNKKIYSLKEVAEGIKKTIHDAFRGTYWIKAEIAKVNRYEQSGHCYPELVWKENGVLVAQVKANLWKEHYERINSRFVELTREPLKDGISILMNAAIRFHPVYGLTLDIRDIDASYTLGEMARKKMETIRMLQQEGIFDRNKRLPMPLLPQRVAVISVQSSKGYADFLNVIENNTWGYRFFHMLFPSLLQGDAAVETMTAQLNRIRKVAAHFDVVAIIRGGGGDVGLSCYDDYRLAREVALFPVPVLAGIGHSTNETVVQMVAYRNNITPTALAEFLLQQFHNFSVPLKESQRKVAEGSRQMLKDANTDLAGLSRLYRSSAQRLLDTQKERLTALGSRIGRVPRKMMEVEMQELGRRGQDLRKSLNYQLSVAARDLKGLDDRARLLDPKQVLKRGYSITRTGGRSVRDSASLKPGDRLVTEFHEGKAVSIVESTSKK